MVGSSDTASAVLGFNIIHTNGAASELQRRLSRYRYFVSELSIASFIGKSSTAFG
jgi:hypothetical protein